MKKKHNKQNIRKWGKLTHDKGWIYIPKLLIRHQAELGITSAELNVILVILSYWWEKEEKPWPSVATMARQIGKNPSTVRRLLTSLVEKKYLRKTRRNNPLNEKGQLSNLQDLNGLVNALGEIAARAQEDNL